MDKPDLEELRRKRLRMLQIDSESRAKSSDQNVQADGTPTSDSTVASLDNPDSRNAIGEHAPQHLANFFNTNNLISANGTPGNATVGPVFICLTDSQLGGLFRSFQGISLPVPNQQCSSSGNSLPCASGDHSLKHLLTTSIQSAASTAPVSNHFLDDMETRDELLVSSSNQSMPENENCSEDNVCLTLDVSDCEDKKPSEHHDELIRCSPSPRLNNHRPKNTTSTSTSPWNAASSYSLANLGLSSPSTSSYRRNSSPPPTSLLEDSLSQGSQDFTNQQDDNFPSTSKGRSSTPLPGPSTRWRSTTPPWLREVLESQKCSSQNSHSGKKSYSLSTTSKERSRSPSPVPSTRRRSPTPPWLRVVRESRKSSSNDVCGRECSSSAVVPWRNVRASTSANVVTVSDDENDTDFVPKKRGRPKGSKNKYNRKSDPKTPPKDDSAGQPTCRICLSPENLCVTSCGHCFHEKCLTQWFVMSKQESKILKRCPYCSQYVEHTVPFYM